MLDEGIRELEIKANEAFDSYRDLYGPDMCPSFMLLCLIVRVERWDGDVR